MLVSLPEPLPPMLATLGEVPTGEQWAFEWKWDGVRAVVGSNGDRVRVHSRNLRDITATYPELSRLAGLVAGTALLDGELVTLDELGRPDFGRLQSRMHVASPTVALLRDYPVCYYVFDLLRLDGADLLDLPYQHRRQRLARLELNHPPLLRTPDHYTNTSGADLLDVAAEYGLEGVVAKRLDSAYRPGTRSRNWIKTPLRLTQEVVIGGWTPGQRRRAGMLGSLLLGAHDDTGALVYIGHVGTGFSDAALRDMQARLRPLRRESSPFGTEVPRDRARQATWVDPVLVGEVEHRQWTAEGRLRHPSWRGLRTDKRPHEVRLPR